jgi:hypothetical protein
MIMNWTGALAFVACLGFTGLAACSDARSHDVTGPVAPALAAASDQRASTFTTNVVVPFGFEATECGNETVVVSGRVRLVMHGTISSSGNIHAVAHVNPQNIRGFGVTTGAEYLAPGMLQEVTNMNGPAPVTETLVNNFELVGLGRAPDFTVHHNMHLTINSNGEVTAAFDHLTVECR